MNILTTNDLMTVRQHGAMEHTIPPCDLDEVRRYRLARIQTELVRQDLAGIILYDQLNTRYATVVPELCQVVRQCHSSRS